MFLNVSETLDSMETMIKERDELERKIAKAKRGPRDLGGIAMDGMPKSKANRPDAKHAMDALKAMILQQDKIKKRLDFLAEELRPMIDEMPLGSRRVLSARYLDCLSVEKASVILPYNRSSLNRQLKEYKKDLLTKLATEGDKTKSHPL